MAERSSDTKYKPNEAVFEFDFKTVSGPVCALMRVKCQKTTELELVVVTARSDSSVERIIILHG